MSEDTVRPIIVIKRKKNAAGHHGGAWKVAYADFVTAMMAFFMVMWLVASSTRNNARPCSSTSITRAWSRGTASKPRRDRQVPVAPAPA